VHGKDGQVVSIKALGANRRESIDIDLVTFID
jgi:hypothetical protein